MSNKTKRIVFISSFAVGFLALLLIGTFLDLQISQSLCVLSEGEYLSTNAFVLFFEAIGENVLYLLLGCAVAIIFFYLNNIANNKLKITLKVVFFIIGLLVWFYSTQKVMEYLAEYMGSTPYLKNIHVVAIEIVVSLLINTLIILAFKNCKQETINALFKWAIVVIVSAIIANGIVQGIKLFWGRMRYRAMNLIGDTSGFTPWYSINGKPALTDEQLLLGLTSDSFKSFPSGHTCAAASLFCLICLPSVLDKYSNKTSKILCWTIPTVYTIIVALTRIMCGAHFFTDVLIGGSVCFITTYLLKWLIIDKNFNPFKKHTKAVNIEEKQTNK